jgi:hypothetical protein
MSELLDSMYPTTGTDRGVGSLQPRAVGGCIAQLAIRSSVCGPSDRRVPGDSVS